MTESRLQPQRYLGLELAGAKNPKTTLAVIEYYPKENKVFLLDIHDRIGAEEDESADHVLIRHLRDQFANHPKGTVSLAVNVPLELPPGIPCTKKTSQFPEKSTLPAVKWMRDTVKKAARSGGSGPRVKEFTPYTQRPIELWVRYHVFPDLPERLHFDIDETLGGNKAPLTARMQFLKYHLAETKMFEVWPKLTVGCLAAKLKLSGRVLSSYRRLEEGAFARSEILEAFSKSFGIFIYEKDVRKLSHSLSAFDAFVCAYTALLADNGKCAVPPKGFPVSSGWVHYPE